MFQLFELYYYNFKHKITLVSYNFIISRLKQKMDKTKKSAESLAKKCDESLLNGDIDYEVYDLFFSKKKEEFKQIQEIYQNVKDRKDSYLERLAK